MKTTATVDCSFIQKKSPQQVALHVSFGGFYPDALPESYPKEICVLPPDRTGDLV